MCSLNYKVCSILLIFMLALGWCWILGSEHIKLHWRLVGSARRPSRKILSLRNIHRYSIQPALVFTKTWMIWRRHPYPHKNVLKPASISKQNLFLSMDMAAQKISTDCVGCNLAYYYAKDLLFMNTNTSSFCSKFKCCVASFYILRVSFYIHMATEVRTCHNPLRRKERWYFYQIQ